MFPLLNRLREKNFDKWLPGYLRPRGRAICVARSSEGPRHLLFAFCDHYEPLLEAAPAEAGARAGASAGPRATRRWPAASATPTAARRATRSSSPARSTRPSTSTRWPSWRAPASARSSSTCTTTATRRDAARSEIARYLQLFAGHGHLSRKGGRLRYAFIHGNWCLANARSDGRWCGVDDELPLLFETGCYADFTFPSAPDESQPDIVNQIYWPDRRSARAAAPTSRASARGWARASTIAS